MHARGDDVLRLHRRRACGRALAAPGRRDHAAGGDAAFVVAGVYDPGFSTSNAASPRFGPDGTLYLTAIPSGQSKGRLYEAPRVEGGGYGKATEVPGLADIGGTFVAARDGLLAYYSQLGPDGKSDIYRATRATTTSAWTGIRVDELGAAGVIDAPGFLSEDRCRLYFLSDRSTGQNAFRIWLATRKP